jgi:hypothetical protein
MRIYLPADLAAEYVATGRWRIVYVTSERVASAHPIVRPNGAVLERIEGVE